MVSRDEVMAALAAIPGPDGRASLPESGAVSGVTIRDGKVFAAIAIDPARAKAMEPMRAEAEAAIRAIPGVAGAVVTLTAESARAAARASGAHDHQGDAPRELRGRPASDRRGEGRIPASRTFGPVGWAHSRPRPGDDSWTGDRRRESEGHL